MVQKEEKSLEVQGEEVALTRKTEKESQKTLGPLYIMFRQKEYKPIGRKADLKLTSENPIPFAELAAKIQDLQSLKNELWPGIAESESFAFSCCSP